MNIKYTLIGALSVLILASCGNSADDDAIEGNVQTSASTNLTDTVVNPATAIPVSNNTNTVTTPGNTIQSPVITKGAQLNPAHGQPGHRCDIAVGAPLDSKPAATTSAPNVTIDPFSTTQPKNAPGVTVTSTPQTTPVTTTKTSTAGLNPAHGQPGHRCDLAVGAALDSKPAATATTTQSLPLIPSAEIKPSPIVSPAGPASTPVAKTVTAPGMNPPHGEPGHRCDISVGAPLNSPPKKN
ncbi:MAG TPA: hypothetical protein VMZ03_03005 [Chitinophagaceae bacterium]|nr:hypothetical protein [Chitinophagaceae bacterium]